MNAASLIAASGSDARRLLAATLEAKLPRLTQGWDALAQGELLHWMDLLHAEDPPSAQAVAERLDQLLGALRSVGGLARWLLTGLRQHSRHPQRQRAYFRLDDPAAVAALHGEAAAADLHRLLPVLGLLLQGLAGRAMTVQARHQSLLNGPPLRPVLTRSHLLLPDCYTLLDGPDRYRLYRAAVAHAVAHLRFSPAAQAAAALKPMAQAVVATLEDARVEALLAREMPGVQAWFAEFLAREVAAPPLSFTGLTARLSRALALPAHEDDNFWVNKGRRLFDETAREHGLEDHAAFRRIGSVLANDLGQMRVRHQPQQDAVPMPYRDDHSFLWDHGLPDQPPPPDEAQSLQVQGVALQVQLREAQANPDSPAATPTRPLELARHLHGEWDHRLQGMRPDWCTVIEQHPPWHSAIAVGVHGERSGAPAPLRLARARSLSRARRLRRQWEGDDIDLNAAIEVLVERRQGLSPEARLFLRPGREAPAMSLLVLLDLSASANDRIAPGSMRSLLDVQKQAALMLVQAHGDGRDRLAIDGFCSDTREAVHYYRLLDFDAPRHAAALGPLRAAQAAWSTRMGAALRQATQRLLAEATSPHRALIVVTDGAPSDVDVADPDYLVLDAQHAVAQARRQGLQVCCVAVDPQAHRYVNTIFGWRNYRIVDAPETLPQHLGALYARLIAR